MKYFAVRNLRTKAKETKSMSTQYLKPDFDGLYTITDQLVLALTYYDIFWWSLLFFSGVATTPHSTEQNLFVEHYIDQKTLENP